MLIDRCIVTLLNIIKFKKNFLIITSKNLNTNETDEQLDIVDIVDKIDITDIVDEIDIVDNATDVAVFEKLKANVVDVVKASDIVSQTALTATTATTNTKIIFLN